MNRIAAAAALALAAACGNSDADTQAVADSATVPAPPAQAAAPAPASTVTDPQIAAIVVAANQVDIDAGELAKERATDSRVKEFAQRMITDHTGVNTAATELVTRLGVTPEPNAISQQLTQGGEQNLAALRGQSGAAFDGAY